jgi:hypothetical protein
VLSITYKFYQHYFSIIHLVTILPLSFFFLSFLLNLSINLIIPCHFLIFFFLFLKIIDKDVYGFIIDLTSLAYAPSGFAHSDSLSNVIKNKYGLTYVRDFNRSSVHLPGCQCGPKGTSIEMDMTYALEDGQLGGQSMTMKAPIDTTISVSFRRTFLKLEKVPAYRVRKHHPKSGFNSVTYENDTESFLRPRDTHCVTRHLLKSVDLHSRSLSSTQGVKKQKKEVKRVEGRKEKKKMKEERNVEEKKGGVRDSMSHMAGQDSRHHQSQHAEQEEESFLAQESTSRKQQQHKDRLPMLSAQHDLTAPQESDAQLLYMVDCTAPLAVQRALVEGIRWWDEAFQYVS